MKVLINNDTKQPFLVIRESTDECEIAPLKNFYFVDEDIFKIPLDYTKEQYQAKEMACFGLTRNSIMSTNEQGEILHNRVSYQVEVREVGKN